MTRRNDPRQGRIAMQASYTLPRLAAALLVTVLVAACQPTTGVRSDATGAIETRAVQLGQRGEHAAAARSWEEAAATAPQPRANGLWLAAAREWLAAGDRAAVERTLGRLAEPVTAADSQERRRLMAELALLARQPEKALALLDESGAPPDPASLATRARAQFALGRVPEAVVTLVSREAQLRGDEARLANQAMIVESVAGAARRGADVRPPPGTDQVVAGWLELGRIEADAAIGSAGTRSQLQAWRLRYPAHPANATLWPELAERYTSSIEPSSHIALLLPLSGRAASAGLAVQNGFLSAYYQQPEGTRPQIRFYDVAASDAGSAYLAALADGARIVVGPLTREEVARLASIADGRAKTLVLNFLPEGTITPSDFFQFALSPEDEARQSARRAVADGLASGVALVPANDWGQRVLEAFSEELAAAGGTLAARSVYAPGTTDFRDIINGLIDLKPVESDSGQPTFIYRPDAQFIFVAAQSVTGRLIRTQLRFNYAGSLPMYSTSDIFEPGGSGNNDLDGVIFPDMPWVIDVAGPAARQREIAASTWPDRSPARSRLYAFGYDAYGIVAELTRRRAPFGGAVAGLTGRFSLDAQGRVHRQLEFVQVDGGLPRPLLQSGLGPGQ
jgi:outer membrane PBP1 activator LpoA protein